MTVLPSAGPISHITASQSQPDTGSSEIPVLQSTGLVSQMTYSQIPTRKKVQLTTSAYSAAVQHHPDSDLEQQTYPTSPVHPKEEEGEVSDQVTDISKQKPD